MSLFPQWLGCLVVVRQETAVAWLLGVWDRNLMDHVTAKEPGMFASRLIPGSSQPGLNVSSSWSSRQTSRPATRWSTVC